MWVFNYDGPLFYPILQISWVYFFVCLNICNTGTIDNIQYSLIAYLFLFA